MESQGRGLLGAQGEYSPLTDVGNGSRGGECPLPSEIKMQFGKTITCLGSWESKTSWFRCQEERL